jgi:sugar phosphate isomerase/epimerase
VEIRDIGLTLDNIGDWGKLRQLEQRLEYAASLGFRLVEVDIAPFHLIINGEIHRPSLDNLVAVLRAFDLRYSVHGLMRLNLAYDPRHELCRRIMVGQIEVCRALGATRLVYHSGLQALDLVRYGVRRSLLTEDELAAGARREVAAFRELAPLAADAGVVIGMENSDSHQWEHDLVARFGLPRSELSKHHARLHVEPILRQLEAIDHPNVGMAMDVGHLYIASRDMGFDYLEGISQAAPWVRHVHISDNSGSLDQGFDIESDRWAFGEADIHMPPGWGSVPYLDVFACWPEYEGDLILEVKPGFIDCAEQGLHTMRRLLDDASAEAAHRSKQKVEKER